MNQNVITLTKRTRVFVLLNGNLCKQRNYWFCPYLLAPRGRMKKPLLVKKVERLFVQSSECDEKIESFASPPYFITLLNCKCECTLHGSTVEPRYNEPLYNETLRMTNNFLYPSNSKINEKEPRYNETSLQRKHFASPLALRYVEIPLY